MRYGPAVRNLIGILAVIAFVAGPTAAHLELARPLVGFAVFALGGLVALVVGLASLVQLVRGRGLTTGGGLAVLAALVFVAGASQGRGHPRINDFTTDPADPPAFRAAAAIPENVGRDLSYPAAFAPIQRACCADLRPATLAVAPDEARVRALRTAGELSGWTTTRDDPAAQEVEGTVTSALFRFVDDVVIRVRPDGTGSRVDVRSKSRDGQGDLGANAGRIRDIVGRLEAAR
jgi:uncharacterized protein (DUF1499 family)